MNPGILDKIVVGFIGASLLLIAVGLVYGIVRVIMEVTS